MTDGGYELINDVLVLGHDSDSKLRMEREAAAQCYTIDYIIHLQLSSELTLFLTFDRSTHHHVHC
jgi:hypothetical protein